MFTRAAIEWLPPLDTEDEYETEEQAREAYGHLVTEGRTVSLWDRSAGMVESNDPESKPRGRDS
jgi:hypothetical protein